MRGFPLLAPVVVNTITGMPDKILVREFLFLLSFNIALSIGCRIREAIFAPIFDEVNFRSVFWIQLRFLCNLGIFILCLGFGEIGQKVARPRLTRCKDDGRC